MSEWKLVPVEPTTEMLLAGQRSALTRDVWRHMLDAAPVQQESESVETFRASLIKILDEPDAEMLAAFQNAFSNQLHRRRHKPGLESAELAGIRALLKVAMNRERPPVAPVQQAEPVAWVEVHDRDEGPYEFHGRKLLPAGQHELYLHPPPAEVQRLREFVQSVVDSRWIVGAGIRERARRALEGE